jgi:hypothetical protein
MLSNNAIVGALIFIIMILGANAIMYGIARSMSRGGDVRWISALKQGLTKPLENQRNQSMDELRQKMEKLEKNGKGEE